MVEKIELDLMFSVSVFYSEKEPLGVASSVDVIL
jgi:hypothetical protein